MYEYIQRNYRLCHIAHGTITMKNYLQLYGISYLDKPFYSGAGCRKHARAGVNLTENREGYLDALGIYYRIFGASVVLAFPFLVSKCSLEILTSLLQAEVVVYDLDRAIPSLIPLRYASCLLIEFHQFIALFAKSMVWLVIAIFLKVNRVPEQKYSQ